ncbi:MAG: hypothetical protein ACE5JZ_06940 [Kiloniellales bacterium]
MLRVGRVVGGLGHLDAMWYAARMKRLTVLPALIVALTLLPAAGFGQEPRYGPWPGGDGDIEVLIQELETLIRRAEVARAADPQFLSDLRATLQRYRVPWPVTRVSDDFSDGDYTRNPTWTVHAGAFTIDRRHGLRSRVASQPVAEGGAPEAGGSNADKEGRKDPGSYEDLAGSILKQILKGADNKPGGDAQSPPRNDLVWGPPTDSNWASEGETQRGEEPAPAAPPAATPAPAPRPANRAEISTAFALTDTFSIHLELASLADEGQVLVGPYQGPDRAAGYRLAFGPARLPSLQLLAVSPRGVRDIAAHDEPLAVEVGAPHRLEWNRWPDGLMVVLVDGRVVMRAADRGFSGGFDGLTLINAGGDWALRSILVRGTR